MADHEWEINSNFDTFRVDKGEVGLDNKAPRAVPTIYVDNYSKTFVRTRCRLVMQ